MAINVRDPKTGVRWPIDGGTDEAEDYPSWCPGCGDEIEGDEEHAAR